MQNTCAASPPSSSFGTVSMGQIIQALDVLALDNLYIGPLRDVQRQELPMHYYLT